MVVFSDRESFKNMEGKRRNQAGEARAGREAVLSSEQLCGSFTQCFFLSLYLYSKQFLHVLHGTMPFCFLKLKGTL